VAFADEDEPEDPDELDEPDELEEPDDEPEESEDGEVLLEDSDFAEFESPPPESLSFLVSPFAGEPDLLDDFAESERASLR
jgi:hypothetical protein